MQLTDFQKIVAMNTLAGVGMGLVGIFIPIYLLEINYSLSEVILWLLVHHSSLLVGAFISVYVSNKIGLVKCWYIRAVLIAFLFGGFILLPLLPDFPNLFFLLGILSGLEAAFFWIPYNILTVRKTEENTMGSALAFISNIGSLVGILVPGIAAIIIVSFGYSSLFVIAFIFILFSLFPVLSLRHEKTNFQFNFPAIKNVIRNNRRFILPEILDNLGQDAQVIWTLFIFITALTILDIGMLGIFAGLVSIFITHIAGALIDRWNKKRVVRFGAVLSTLLWLASYLIAIYSPTPLLLYLVTILRGFAIGIFVTAYGAIMFNRARSTDAQFLVLREVPTIFGRVVLFLIALYFISIGRFELVFLIVAILSLYFWFNDLDELIRKDNNL